jgi:1-aminocyclopropane-1-carboxylate deaminase/D-cysteine desulfhydrase-like pyridoxal-dependent ACC family enzyme
VATAQIVMLVVAAVIGVPVVGYTAYKAYQKVQGAAGATPEEKLQSFLQSLGIVQTAEEIKGNIDQIKAFAVVVVAQSTVMRVVDSEQQAAILASFVAIKTAVGSESVTSVKRS